MAEVVDRVMHIETPLGEDVLLFRSMRAREEISRLSEFDVELLSERGDIDLDEILGKNVTVRLALTDDQPRYLNGYVTRFAQSGVYGRYHRYRAMVRPWLWFLTRTADCRIFQELSVPDIVKTVFADCPANDYCLELTNAYRKWSYCVQYRETDYNFVSRLLEHEGIYFYFRHTNGHNTLVLTDSYSKQAPAPGYATVPYIGPDRLVTADVEHIDGWHFEREIQPGAYVHDDYDLERPSVELKTQKTMSWRYAPNTFEVYDYPGAYLQKGDGESYASVRLEELGTQYETITATTNARGIGAGALFSLTGYPRGDQNREHMVIAAASEMESNAYESMNSVGGASFRCTLQAISTAYQFRPRRATPKPFVQGPQTAVVVGPAGEQIHTDHLGRVKVQFHWDRLGRKDENSSGWIRVSHPWAGKGWGAVATPRIGQEVIVDFLEGDPDRPIITGRVYNAECQPPFGFPAGAVVSGIKSSTHKGSGYNELSMDDTPKKEKITIHGQYDMNTTVEHDQTTTVHNNRTDVIDVDDSETVKGTQTIHVKGNQKTNVDTNREEMVKGTETITVIGHRKETVNSGEDVTVTGGRTHTVNGVQQTSISLAEMHSVKLGRMHNVGAGEMIDIVGGQMVNIGALQMITVGGAQLVTVGPLQKVTVSGAHKLSAATISETAKTTVNVKAGSTATIEATTIVLKAGSSKIVMDSSGITINGAKLTAKADGSCTINGGGGIKLKGPNIGEN